MATWIVLVEAATSAGGGAISVEEVQSLAGLLAAGGALHRPDRYAVQLEISGTRPVDALDRALTLWDDAVATLGLARWPLVRAEVFTPEQLDWELDHWGTEAKGTAVHAPGDAGAVESPVDELLRELFRDPLTGLANETAFAAELDRVLARSASTRSHPAVVRLDLNGFDDVNRNFGDGTGDEILFAVAQRLAEVVRPNDLVARLGGDDFAILLDGTSPEAAASVSARIISALHAPLVVDGCEVELVGSAGVAMGSSGQVAEDVMADAASALALAKAAGGDRSETFAAHPEPAAVEVEALPRPAASHDRLSYLLLLQRAAAAANEATTLHQAAEIVLGQVCAHTGWPLGHLLVVPPERPRELVSTTVWCTPGDHLYRTFRRRSETVRFASGVGLPGRVLATGQPAWISDLVGDPTSQRAIAATADGLHAALASPVLVGDEVVAVLEFFSPDQLPVDASLLEVLTTVGRQLGRILQRTRANDALWESQALLREAQALGRLGSWYSDLRTGRTTWSDELYDILGLDPATTVPTLDAFLAVVHPEDRDLVEADARRTAIVGPGDPVEFRVVRADGETRWAVRRSSFRYDEQGAVAYHATVQDIHDYKRTAECSLSCEVRWHLMLQGSQEMLTLLNRDGAIRLSFAPAGLDALGSRHGDRAMLVEFVHPDDVQIVRHVLAELLADPSASVAFQARFRDDVGQWHWFDSIATNLLDEPLIGAIVLNSLDVTEQKWLQERLGETALRR